MVVSSFSTASFSTSLDWCLLASTFDGTASPTAHLDDGNRRVLSQPVLDHLLRSPGLKPPDIRILELLLDNLVQPVQAAIVTTDPLVKLEIQTTQRGAVLELGLVVDICGSKAINLDATW